MTVNRLLMTVIVDENGMRVISNMANIGTLVMSLAVILIRIIKKYHSL